MNSHIDEILAKLDPEEIRVRAYYVYQRRLHEGLPGDERSDWEEAISELYHEAEQSGASESKIGGASKSAGRILKPERAGAAVPAESPSDGGGLQRIRGIGPGVERRLHDCGILSPAQIAAWSEEDVRDIAKRCGLGGKIERDRWVEQARSLS